MSDYLWDKTGEADAETERLENLLGQLRFQPTPFDLPAELPAREFRAARTRRGVLAWPRLAFAASLALAMLAGSWLVIKQRPGATGDGHQLAAQNNQAGAAENHSTDAAKKTNDAATKPTEGTSESDAADEKKLKDSPGVAPPKRNGTRRKERTAVPARPRVPDVAANEPRRVDVARLAAEREAAEKVLYALRVTSEKLNYARQQVEESSRRDDNR